MAHRGSETKDPAFLPRLQRKPRVKGGTYWYCPNLITKNPDLRTDEVYVLTKVSQLKDDPTVTIRYNYHPTDDREFQVMWEDLRKAKL